MSWQQLDMNGCLIASWQQYDISCGEDECDRAYSEVRQMRASLHMIQSIHYMQG